MRDGPALLAGLVVCGQCGSKMTVRYQRGGQADSDPRRPRQGRVAARPAPRAPGPAQVTPEPRQHGEGSTPAACSSKLSIAAFAVIMCPLEENK